MVVENNLINDLRGKVLDKLEKYKSDNGAYYDKFKEEYDNIKDSNVGVEKVDSVNKLKNLLNKISRLVEPKPVFIEVVPECQNNDFRNENEKTELRYNIFDLDRKIKNLTKENSKILQSIKESRKKYKQSREHNKLLESVILQWDKENQEQIDKYNLLLSEKEKVESKLTEEEERRDEYQNQVSDARENIDKILAKIEQKKSNGDDYEKEFLELQTAMINFIEVKNSENYRLNKIIEDRQQEILVKFVLLEQKNDEYVKKYRENMLKKMGLSLLLKNEQTKNEWSQKERNNFKDISDDLSQKFHDMSKDRNLYIDSYYALAEKSKNKSENIRLLEYENKHLVSQTAIYRKVAYERSEEISKQKEEIKLLKESELLIKEELRGLEELEKGKNNELAEYLLQIQQKEREIGEIRASKNASVAEMTEKQGVIDDMQREIDRKNRNIARIKENLSEKKTELEAKENELEAKENELSEKKTEIGLLTGELSTKGREVVSLKLNVSTKTSENARLLQELGEKNKKYKKLQEELEPFGDIKKQFESLRDENAKLKNVLSDKNELEQKKSLQINMNNLMKIMEILGISTDNKISKSQMSTNELIALMDKMNISILKRLQEVEIIEKRQGLLDVVREAFHQLTSAVDNHNKPVEMSDISSLNPQNTDEFNSKAGELQRAISTSTGKKITKEEKDKLEKRIQELEQMNMNFFTMLFAFSGEVLDLSKIQESEEKVKVLESTLNELKKKQDKTAENIREERDANKILKQLNAMRTVEIEKQARDILNKQGRIERDALEIEQLQKSITSSSDNNELLKKELEESKQKIQDLELINQKNNLSEELTTKLDEIKQNEEKISQILAENSQLKQRNIELESKISDQSKEVSKINNDIKEFERFLPEIMKFKTAKKIDLYSDSIGKISNLILNNSINITINSSSKEIQDIYEKLLEIIKEYNTYQEYSFDDNKFFDKPFTSTAVKEYISTFNTEIDNLVSLFEIVKESFNTEIDSNNKIILSMILKDRKNYNKSYATMLDEMEKLINKYTDNNDIDFENIGQLYSILTKYFELKEADKAVTIRTTFFGGAVLMNFWVPIALIVCIIIIVLLIYAIYSKNKKYIKSSGSVYIDFKPYVEKLNY